MTNSSISSFDFLAPHDHYSSRASFLIVSAAMMMIFLKSIMGLLIVTKATMMTTMIILFESIMDLLIVRAGVSGAAERELQVRGGSQPAGEGRGCNKTTSRVSHQEAFRNPLPSANRAETAILAQKKNWDLQIRNIRRGKTGTCSK